ncbi:hypothetical protein ARALYDRAFT_907350 [Arabidopsis lyrata subsp. lyrata]|uniref:Protein kinase domain-containing protein n=1 Tax=Arabidopsis lyrata subsp. lyrata TaxID=81972 RepID=D7LW65_ARALL|nr:hypothetical protein ARALYDRAFT_907350 [Arabidopsis lyrata subsp. lyrata]
MGPSPTLDVVQICHFMGVIHRDLKPENFLLASTDENAMLKATDFGLSVFIEEFRDGTDAEKKPRQSLRDAAPLEPDAHGSRKDSEKKHSEHHQTSFQSISSDVLEVFGLLECYFYWLKDTNLNYRRQNERNWRSNMHSERHERPAMGRDRVWNRDDERGAGSRQSYRADRDKFNGNGRSGFSGSWTRNEKKWDHDLFEEANKSPAKDTEEEQVANVEFLLAS